MDIGSIKSIALTKISDAGRAAEVTVTGSKGQKVFSREACRYFLKELYSQFYTISPADGKSAQTAAYKAVGGDGVITGVTAGAQGTAFASAEGASALPVSASKFRFTGKGWGHAVGMSQEGAKGMAAAGFDHKSILAHYFPGTTLG